MIAVGLVLHTRGLCSSALEWDYTT